MACICKRIQLLIKYFKLRMGCQPNYLVSCCFDSIIQTAQYPVPQSNQQNRGLLNPFSKYKQSKHIPPPYIKGSLFIDHSSMLTSDNQAICNKIVIKSISKIPEDSETLIYIVLLARNFERAGDRIVNISRQVHQIVTGIDLKASD